ncbi:MAG: fumarate hydratase [Oscillospiraceae bacterium]|nr:fumarate hydratase [Oscillospiraceae bacterium]
MKEIYFEDIASAVAKASIEANLYLPKDIIKAQEKAAKTETGELPSSIFSVMKDNLNAAKELGIPICQDTGMAIVFIEIGREVHLNCDLKEAVNDGVRRGYKEGHLRFSVVRDPILRGNTGDNTPAIIYTDITEGDSLKITVAPKGFGSENMSRQKMFLPTASKEDIIGFITETVSIAGGNPCPPIVIGVGIGGDFEYSAFLSKKALTRDISVSNADKFYSDMEKEALTAVNKLGIGPQGLGGKTTALAVNIETYPTHIAGLPVAVNIGCHVNRHKSILL